ncbi:rho GTPase-activating protein 27 [Neosynchiropus ocellatus]
MATRTVQHSQGVGLVLVEFHYEYQGRDGALVSIQPNERYVLLAKTNEHWWQVQSSCGSKPFYIPAQYVKELPSEIPSPLDFAQPLSPKPEPLPVAAPVQTPVPIPKIVDEPNGTRNKPGDEVTIRLRPDAAGSHRKTENRMSTFGVPLDVQDPVPPPRHHSSISTGGPAESRTTNAAVNMLDTTPQTQVRSQFFPKTEAIPVETPTVPLDRPHSPPKEPEESAGVDGSCAVRSGEERSKEEARIETGSGEAGANKERHKSSGDSGASGSMDEECSSNSNHIYESILDLNLDPALLTGGPLSPDLSSEEGEGVWEQLLDEVSGRTYYYNSVTGATSWSTPEPASKGPEPQPPPLPAEDYPVAPMPQVPGHRRSGSDWAEVGQQHPEASRTFTNDLLLQSHLLEKAGIINKTKVGENGKKIRKNWSQSWTVLHGGILTFYRDPKTTPSGGASKSSQIAPEYSVELRGASVGWASRDKSSRKNVLELKTRLGCEFLMQNDTDSIISDWMKVIEETIRQLEADHQSESEDEDSDRDDRKTASRSSSEQRRVRSKLRRFLQRRPTLQSVKEKGYIRDSVFGCHLDTLCHRENSTVPRFIEKCIKAVERRGETHTLAHNSEYTLIICPHSGLDVDGIYRVSGNLAMIQKLRHQVDHEEQLDLDQWAEIHVVTGALKLFLRELPEPLFPFSSYDKFIAAIQLPDPALRVSYMKDLIRLLPLPNHDTMEVLFRHLCRVVDNRESNRMSAQSVAIVFGPTLLRPQIESAQMTVHMVFQSQIVELILNQYNSIFTAEP